jgi:hypothetical protein
MGGHAVGVQEESGEEGRQRALLHCTGNDL